MKTIANEVMMSVQNTTLSWDQLLELSKITLLLDEYVDPDNCLLLHPFQAACTNFLQRPTACFAHRDTILGVLSVNEVALEEKEIPFATEFIDLNNKPVHRSCSVNAGSCR